jgi:hypothetical protein
MEEKRLVNKALRELPGIPGASGIVGRWFVTVACLCITGLLVPIIFDPWTSGALRWLLVCACAGFLGATGYLGWEAVDAAIDRRNVRVALANVACMSEEEKDVQIAILERQLNRDLDGDGVIGTGRPEPLVIHGNRQNAPRPDTTKTDLEQLLRGCYRYGLTEEALVASGHFSRELFDYALDSRRGILVLMGLVVDRKPKSKGRLALPEEEAVEEFNAQWDDGYMSSNRAETAKA